MSSCAQYPCPCGKRPDLSSRRRYQHKRSWTTPTCATGLPTSATNLYAAAAGNRAVTTGVRATLRRIGKALQEGQVQVEKGKKAQTS